MNTALFRYALEVEKTGSITRAASNLYMSQPTLSKGIRDLEEEIGFPVFKRTSKGVIPTSRGREFLRHAGNIVAQLQKMEQALQRGSETHRMFSLAIPRVGYAAQAAAELAATFREGSSMEVEILEAGALETVEAVAEGRVVLGVVRCHAEDREYFRKYFGEKELQAAALGGGDLFALMSDAHPLAEKEDIRPEELLFYVEVAFGDGQVPYIRRSEAETVSGCLQNPRQILVYDRGTLEDMLRTNPGTYCWSPPLTREALERQHLVQKVRGGRYEDYLLFRRGYGLSPLDEAFLDILSRHTPGN